MALKKLAKILLVDDSVADNYLHRRLITKLGLAEEIVVAHNGIEALDYLTVPVNGAYARPELLFLDINMPGMDGWEFLDAYERLEADRKAGMVICMLTTAYSDRDLDRARQHGIVNDYLGKPLDEEKLLRAYHKAMRG